MTTTVKEEGLMVFVDNLGEGANGKEIADIFVKYGKLIKVMVARCKPWIAYVHFEDKKDAREAVRCLDMTYINGKQVRVKSTKENCSNEWRSSEVYVSGLGDCPDQQKVIGTFRIFGNLKHVWVNRSGEAFVLFGEVKSASGAVRCLDGTKLNGRKIKVQLASELTAEASRLTARACVDGLGEGAYVKELTDIFELYGRIQHVWIDYHQPGQAYVFFQDEDDARNAVKSLDRSWINGKRVRVASSMTECRWSIWKPGSEPQMSATDLKGLPDRSCQSSSSSSDSSTSPNNNNIDNNDNDNNINININVNKSTHPNTPGSTATTSSSSYDDQDGWRSDERMRNERSARKRKHCAEEEKEELSERLLKIKMLVNLAETQLHQFIKDRLGREQLDN